MPFNGSHTEKKKFLIRVVFSDILCDVYLKYKKRTDFMASDVLK